MENKPLVIDSNHLCIFCLCEVKASKNHVFPLHHLTSKHDTNLGDVFQDMVVPGAPLPVLDRMKVLVVACQGCAHLCEELLYKYQADVEIKSCIKLLFDKMRKVGLEDKYKNCESPLAVFHSGIVQRLRKKIMAKFYLQLGYKPNQLSTKTLAGPQRSPNRVDFRMPEFELPVEKICSYLAIEDIKNLSLVYKALHVLVFPSLIKSSFISFRNRSEIAALSEFVKTPFNDWNAQNKIKRKKHVNLLIKSESLDDSDESRSALLELLRECGPQIRHLKLVYGYTSLRHVVANVFRDNNSIPVLGIGNELFPSMRALDINFEFQWNKGMVRNDEIPYNGDMDKDYRQQQINACVPFLKAVFGNSSILKGLKMVCDEEEVGSLLKLIGESGLCVDTLEVIDTFITAADLANLHSLPLRKVDLNGLVLQDPQALTDFLESQKDTLEYLKWSWGAKKSPHFTFPQMKKLKTYKPSWTTGITNTQNLPPISYHAQLPTLREVELDNEIVFPINDGKPTTSVKKLSILECSSFESSHLNKAAAVFQCLSKLEIPVVEDLFNCWKELGSLVELTLYPSWESDNTITLIDESISGIYVYNSSEKTFTEEEIRKYAEKYEEVKAQRSLALLTRLELLRLRRGLKLADVGCKLVLIEMESLKCVDFCGAHPRIVGTSSQVLDEMGEKMDLMFGEIGKWP